MRFAEAVEEAPGLPMTQERLATPEAEAGG